MQRFRQERTERTPEGAVPLAGRLSLIAYLFVVSAAFGFLQPFQPLYFRAAGLSRSQMGLVFGAATAIALLLQPLWGRLSDLMDTRRPFIAIGAVSALAAFLCYPHAHGLGALLVLSALGQNGILYLNAVGGVLVGRLVRVGHGGAYARYRVWGSVGYVIVTLVSGAILTGAGNRLDRASLDRMFSTVPLMFLSVVFLAFTVPDAREDHPASKAPKAPLPTNLKWFLVAYFFYVFALYGSTNFLPELMTHVGGTPIWVTGMFAGGVVCEILVMRQSGTFSDRFGRRPLLAAAFTLLPLRLALYAVAGNPLAVFCIQLLHGFNFGIMGAISVALINDLSTDSTRGQAQARLWTVYGVAWAAGPILLGVAAQASLRLMFGLAAAVAAIAAAVFLLTVQETHDVAGFFVSGNAVLRPILSLLGAPPLRKANRAPSRAPQSPEPH
jgi:PPP family 3-phenylpropionic acid transporter